MVLIGPHCDKAFYCKKRYTSVTLAFYGFIENAARHLRSVFIFSFAIDTLWLGQRRKLQKAVVIEKYIPLDIFEESIHAGFKF